MSVIEVRMGKDGENEYLLKLDTSINTNAAELSYQSEKETYDAITVFYHIAKNRFKISPNHTHIVISSGLRQELDKYNKVEYFANIVRPKDLDSKIRISYVTADQESEFSFRGIVPSKSRLTADHLDVGGGNTKGGYFDAGKNFIPVTFPLGTKSFQRLIESKLQGSSLQDYRQTAQKILDDSLGRLIVYEFTNKTDFKSRDVVYISGGIVWAVASMMYPELVYDNAVELKKEDISNFRKQVFENFAKLSKPDLSMLADRELAEASLKNIGRVVKTYDQKALLAGAIWLDELMQQVNTRNPNKKLIFFRNSYVGWISGYIVDKINKQYLGMAKN